MDLIISSRPIGTGVVMDDGAILYFDRRTPEEIYERATNAPGVLQFAQRATNSSASGAVMQAVRAYRDVYQGDFEKNYESAGHLVRVPHGTHLTILEKSWDTSGTEMFRVRITSGVYVNREGFMYHGHFRFYSGK